MDPLYTSSNAAVLGRERAAQRKERRREKERERENMPMPRAGTCTLQVSKFETKGVRLGGDFEKFSYPTIRVCKDSSASSNAITVEFVTRGRFVEVVMGWIANGAKNRQRSPWSMDSPRRPLVDLLGQTQKRPNTEPQGVPEFLD